MRHRSNYALFPVMYVYRIVHAYLVPSFALLPPAPPKKKRFCSRVSCPSRNPSADFRAVGLKQTPQKAEPSADFRGIDLNQLVFPRLLFFSLRNYQKVSPRRICSAGRPQANLVCFHFACGTRHPLTRERSDQASRSG